MANRFFSTDNGVKAWDWGQFPVDRISTAPHGAPLYFESAGRRSTECPPYFPSRPSRYVRCSFIRWDRISSRFFSKQWFSMWPRYGP